MSADPFLWCDESATGSDDGGIRLIIGKNSSKHVNEAQKKALRKDRRTGCTDKLTRSWTHSLFSENALKSSFSICFSIKMCQSDDRMLEASI